MTLSTLVISAATIFFGVMFLIVGVSYLFYKIRNKSSQRIIPND